MGKPHRHLAISADHVLCKIQEPGAVLGALKDLVQRNLINNWNYKTRNRRQRKLEMFIQQQVTADVLGMGKLPSSNERKESMIRTSIFKGW